MTFRLLIICCFLFCSANKQHKFPVFHGTFIIAGICMDGIVIATDSRSTFFDKQGNVVAYFDGSTKLYRYENLLIASSGVESLDNYTLDGLMTSFINSRPRMVNLNTFYDAFLYFASTKVTSKELSQIRSNDFFICGYNGTTPNIRFYQGLVRATLAGVGDFKTNVDKDDNIQNIRQMLTRTNKKNTLLQFDKIIDVIAAERNKNGWGSVGGPSSHGVISQSGIDTVKIQDKYLHTFIKDFAADFIKGRIPMKFRTEEAKKSLTTQFGWFAPRTK